MITLIVCIAGMLLLHTHITSDHKEKTTCTQRLEEYKKTVIKYKNHVATHVGNFLAEHESTVQSLQETIQKSWTYFLEMLIPVKAMWHSYTRKQCEEREKSKSAVRHTEE